MALGDIRVKLKDREYRIEDCTYEAVMRDSMAQNSNEMYGIDFQNDLPYTDDTKSYYLGVGDNGHFKEQIELLHGQMDAFDELLKELEEDDGS
jgi:hypothetical protein